MLSSHVLHRGPHATVGVVTCTEEHAGFSAPESSGEVRIVLVRSGVFLLSSQGTQATVDRRTGYLELPGQERCFAHPAGGDVCTSIAVDTGLWEELADGRNLAPALPVDTRLDLEHRLLLRAAGDGFATLERVLSLAAHAFREQRLPLTRAPGRRSLAEQAREAVLAGHPASGDLRSLARLLEASPSHLSRTFQHHSGMSLSRFRARVRLERALDRLEEGGGDLAELATELGFADQAHLTRNLRTETGHTPTALRRLLAPRGEALQG
jgi:AraC-like DNA-binding protein